MKRVVEFAPHPRAYFATQVRRFGKPASALETVERGALLRCWRLEKFTTRIGQRLCAPICPPRRRIALWRVVSRESEDTESEFFYNNFFG
jgi:hypothetical protein